MRNKRMIAENIEAYLNYINNSNRVSKELKNNMSCERKRRSLATGGGSPIESIAIKRQRRRRSPMMAFFFLVFIFLGISFADCDDEPPVSSRYLELKIGALATRLDEWLSCQRANLLAQQQQQQQQQQPQMDPHQSESPAKQSDDDDAMLCRAHFDGHLCWPISKRGQLVQLACPRAQYAATAKTTSQSGETSTIRSNQDQSLKTVIESIQRQQNVSADSALAASLTPTGNRQLAPAASSTGDAELAARPQFVKLENEGYTGKYVSRICEPEASQTLASQTGVGQPGGNSSSVVQLANWSSEADYNDCWLDSSGQKMRSYDPLDEWIKPTDADGRLFSKLSEQLERIETSIDPFSEPALFEQWAHCIGEIIRQHEAGPQSGSNQQQSGTSNNDSNFCPIIFDGWRCWPATRAGETAYVACPSNQPGFSAERKAHKICTDQGDWWRHPKTDRYWSNYTTCVDTVDLAFRTKILNLYVIGNLISLIALTVSLVIFISFKNLNCTRVTIHKNLFLSFITNNLMWIIWYTYVVNDAELLYSNPLGCRLWHILLHYFLVSNYFWMFCEGLYLHTLLVVAFVSDDKILKWFYLVGWMTPIPITIAYAYKRSYDEDYTNFCWMEESPHNIILMAPIGISLLLNLIFLINIVRVLVTKLRANNSPDTHQTRKAVRATLILIPLLGLHYMLTPFRPEAKSEWEVIYEIIAAVCTSFQGLCVAMLFCFCNGEVISVIRKKLKDSFLRQDRAGGGGDSTMDALRCLIIGQKNHRKTATQNNRARTQSTASGMGKKTMLQTSSLHCKLAAPAEQQLAKSPSGSLMSQNGNGTSNGGRPASDSNASSLLTTVTASPVQQHKSVAANDNEPHLTRPLLQPAGELA